MKHCISKRLNSGYLPGQVLYLKYTSHLPTSKYTTTWAFVDDTVILAVYENPTTALGH